jgi:hypothetical protein
MKLTALRASLLIVLAAQLSFTCTFGHAEVHCPAGIPDLHPRLVAGALLVIPVMVNGVGPYDFMVDTGSQLNVVDPLLASELNLKSQAYVGLVATTSIQKAPVGTLNSLQAGSHVIVHPIAAIQDLGMLQAADPSIRGVLGENFLDHFDLLIDYSHRLLCLDEGKVMEKDVRGQRTPFVLSKHPEGDVPFSDRLDISVNLSGVGTRSVVLQIDSGSDGAILFAGNKDLESLLRRARLQGETRGTFATLPPQDLKLGSRTLRNIPFVTPIRAAVSGSDREEDGVLATVLFQRVYISHSNHFITFDPK